MKSVLISIQLDEARISEKGARAIWNERTKEARRVLRIASSVEKELAERNKK